ncbi:MAG: protein kinase, partial [Candidatus Hydrogenedentota bacterium]
MIGEEIRNYRILKELGKGGMGVVYKANQISLGRMVAMKVLPHHLTSDPAFIKRFENEARAIAKLNHPNIVQIYDIGHHEQIYYYTMEFIEGPSLDEIIYKEGFLSLDRAISIIAQVAKALQYAHGHGIVHRDIKPSNIMIDKSGRVKVTDFGLALQERTTRLTMDGSIVGTPEYMSPEQAAGQTATARSDIYSLGVVFYEILTGKVPFEAESALMVLDKIRTSEPQWPRSLNPDIPVEVEEAIRNMMAKNPRDRYASCQELIQDVRRLKSGEPVSTKTRRPIPFHLPAGRGVLLLIPALILAATLFYLWYRGWPLKEWKQMNERVALLEERWDSVRQQCEVADVPLLEDQVDQMDQELASFKEELKDIQQQYEGSDAMARGKLRQKALRRLREMEPKVHDSEEWLGGVQEQCKDETRRIIAMLESLEMQWKNVRQQCEVAFGVLPLEDEVDQTDQELASFKEELKDIQQQYEGSDAMARGKLRQKALRRLREMEPKVH